MRGDMINPRGSGRNDYRRPSISCLIHGESIGLAVSILSLRLELIQNKW